MRTVLPGKPQAKLQAVSTALWEGQRLVAYISGNALVILSGPHSLIQTIYDDQLLTLEAVVIDEATGNIAVSSSEEVHIYKPYGKEEGDLKWSFQSSLHVPSHDNDVLTLSWGTEEELLIGYSSLRLYQTTGVDTLIWNCSLPKPVKIASFSYDASLIASTSHHDRLIKVWRRQSFGSDDTRFNFTYLPHPTAVTDIHWRRPHDRQQILDHGLFSICADSKIRVWAATDPHGLQALQLWAEIDMQEAIQPRHIETPHQSSDRYAFIIGSEDFRFATERALQAASSDRQRDHHALEHLLEVAKTSPEICVVVDRCGNMSAWGLENVGCKSRKDTDKFNIAHVENVKLSFLRDVKPEQANVKFLTFCSQQSDSPFTLLVHHFDGRIMWYESKVEELFDPSPRQQRLKPKALWTGHDGSVKKIVRSGSGKALISRTNDNEGLIWKQGNDKSGMALTRSSSLSCPEHIHRSCLLQEGDFVVNLHHHSISLWDARSPVARLAVSCAFQVEGKPLCLIPLPNSNTNSLSHYVATITSMMEAIVWKVDIPSRSQQLIDEDSIAAMVPFCASELGMQDDLVFVLPVDPAGSLSTTSEYLDTFAKDLAISYTDSGVLRAWTATLDLDKGSVNWLVTSTTETGIYDPSLASGSSIRKIAVVDSAKTGLTIWDPWSGQLEFDAKYGSSDSIQDLDWSSTPDEQSILAVGFPYKVKILAQMRYDYLNAGPAWVPIREIHIKELTSHPIGDSVWLGSGNLVVGTGNQLYVYDKAVDTSNDKIMDLSIPVHQHQSLSIFDLVTYLNGPLPVFHPQFLAQCILAGKLVQVQRIIIGLYKALKFFVTGDDVDSFVAMRPSDFYVEQKDVSYAAKKETRSSYADIFDDDEPETVTEELATSLIENLAKLAIPQLSSHEQFYLADIIECVATAEKQRRSMDENAMRYLLFFRQHMIRRSQPPATQVSISWREIIWAYHSDSQDILVDLISRHYHGRMLWKHARESGMFMWMTDLTALRAQFEVIARNEYTKTDEKNPIDCSLHYLALKKKNVLVGLWRMAAWNREQSGTQKLLRNDFSEARWKTAALKNAYALLGKRRFGEYAAAFFLLAGNLQDAINVCANQLHDLQLAIAVARVYDGDDSLVLRSLLEEKVLPQAAFEGNRWLATWAFWMLGRRDMAVRVLISPVYTLFDSPETPNLKSKSYLSSDPALVVLYKQLRGKTLQALKGASKVSPRAEWDFVVQNARLYDRMGCDLLALDLVRNWEFLRLPKETNTNGTLPPDPRNMLRRRSSLVVDDMPGPRSPTEQKMKPIGKPAPTVFEEPSTNSLLDSFGF
ncbi:MAG: hypothetical protein Q9175_000508 [Cornicularia normoerica]